MVFTIEIHNGSLWNVRKARVLPPDGTAWKRQLPESISENDVVSGICTVQQGYREAGFTYVSESDLRLDLFIREGNEGGASVSTSDGNKAKAKCTAVQEGADWRFMVEWTKRGN